MNIQAMIDKEFELKLKEFLAQGNKVQAVAAVQKKFKLGLKISKDFVDSLEEPPSFINSDSNL